jgi:hypothetical protein
MTAPQEETADSSSHEAQAASQKHIRRQRLGIRLSPEPYYAIAEQTPAHLKLESYPDANAKAGRLPMGCGIAIALLTPLIIFGLFFGGGGEPGAVCFGAALGWPFAAIGFYVWASGRAVSTTSNWITVDRDTQTIVYMQENKISRLRSQTLRFDQIDHLRLRSRTLVLSRFLRRSQQVVALEMVTDEDFTWIVDSATNVDDILPTAHALAEILERPLRDEHEQEQSTAEAQKLQPSE